MKKPMRYLAIDPGEVHVGVASLFIQPDHYELNCSVLHRPARSFVQLVDVLAPKWPDTLVIAESYQQRAVGHQRFGSGETLQLIGAIRYQVEASGALFTTIQPGKIREDLRAMKIQPLLDEWIEHPRPQKWEHAFSAWRLIGRYLLGHDVARLQALVGETSKEWDAAPLSPYKQDLIAPTLLVS